MICLFGCAGAPTEEPMGVGVSTSARKSTVTKAKPHGARGARRAETVLFEDVGTRYCIGSVSCLKRCEGSACEIRNVYVIRLPRAADIADIRLLVPDAPQRAPGARLRVRIDGTQVESVPRTGRAAMITIPVWRAGRIVTVEAVPDPAAERADYDAIISDVRVSGRAIGPPGELE